MKKELKVVQVNNIQIECATWNSLLGITGWSNGEGFTLDICSKNGGFQSILIAYAEFHIIKDCVKKIENL